MTKATRPTGALSMRPHLLQFLQAKESIAPGEPLQLPGCTIASLFLSSLLTPSDLFTVFSEEGEVPKSYSDRLYYIVTPEMERRGHLFLNQAGMVAFNDFVKEWMMTTLFERVHNLFPLHIQEKEVIEGFIEEFGLEVEMDTLKKACTRYRAKNKIAPLRYRSDGRMNRHGSDQLRPLSSPYACAAISH